MIADKRIVSSRAEFLAAWVLLGLLVFLTIAMVFSAPGQGVSCSPLVLCGFSVIGIWSLISIASDSRFFSLYKIHYYFTFTFMFLAPLCQYTSGYSPWGYQLSDTERLGGCMLVLVWLTFFELSYRIRIRGPRQAAERRGVTRFPDTSTFRGALLAASLVSFATLIGLVGFDNLFVRGEAGIDDSSSPVFTFLNYFLRAVPFFSLGALLLSPKVRDRFPEALILFFMVSVIAWPVSNSRYLSASVCIGLLLCLTYPRMKAKRTHIVDYAFLLAICFVFPLTGLFKDFTLEEIVAGNLGRFSSASGVLGVMVSGFNSVDFDAFSVLCRAQSYIADNGSMLGRQLLSVVFFFVPRAILPIKGTPTGELIAIAQGQGFTNISCPLPAEGYVDFGCFGVLVYAFVFGKFLHRFDFSMDRIGGCDSFLVFTYCGLPGLMFFMLRGALQPTFLRTMGLLSFCFLAWFVTYKMNRSKEVGASRTCSGTSGECAASRRER